METPRFFSIIAACAMLFVLLVGCEQQSIVNPGAPVEETDLAKGGSSNNGNSETPNLSQEAMIVPNADKSIELRSRFNNDIRIDIAAGNVTTPTRMRLTRPYAASNLFTLAPVDRAMPTGITITVSYDHSVLPLGIRPSDLHVFESVNGFFWPTANGAVDSLNQTVSGRAQQSGTFALGAYDHSGNIIFIDGTNGMRVAEWVDPTQDATLRMPGGSELYIPRNAVTQPTEVAMIATRDAVRGTSGASIFTFTPNGTVFSRDLELRLNWKDADPANLHLYFFNERTGYWEVVDTATWDENNRRVVVRVRQAALFALLEIAPSNL